MARATGFNNVFNAGELAPEMRARSDLQQHAHGCALGLNFVGLVGGPMARRSGFWDAGAAKSNAGASVLVPFRRSQSDALMLEFYALGMRVWLSDYTPVMDGLAPYELATPWDEDDLAGLRVKQSNDVLYVVQASGLIRPYALSRLANDDWTIAALDFLDGPWLPENLTTVTLAADAIGPVGASVTLTASAATFDASWIGRRLRLRQTDGGPGGRSWYDKLHTPADQWSPWEMVPSAGRVYRNHSAVTTLGGNTPPIHQSGISSDGYTDWEYVHDGAGVVEITAVASNVSATATVKRILPDAKVNPGLPGFWADDFATTPFRASIYWAQSAYDEFHGWPAAWPEIHEERLVVGGGPNRPDIYDATRTAGYTPTQADFKPGLGTGRVVDDDAVRASTGGDGRRVVWLVSTSALFAGTTEGEVLISSGANEAPLAPTNGPPHTVTDYGSDDVGPVKAHGKVLFVAKNGETLRAVSLSPDQGLSSEDCSVVAGHICARGLAQLAWTASPENICWTRLRDGGFAAFTLHAEMEVKGWTSMELAKGGWTIESIASLPGYGKRDALWMVARRNKGGGQRRILVSSKRSDRMRLDAARLYSGAPANGVTGLDHLDGESITLMAGDGAGNFAQYRDVPVTGGAASLPAGVTAPVIVAGLPYVSRFESLPLDLGGPGSTQGSRQRPTQGTVILTGVEARVGVAVGGVENGLADPIQVPRLPEETTYLAPKAHVEKCTFGGGAARDPRIYVETDSGFDLEILAIRPGEDSN
jgi:hypothetical protein